jgi:hypothetical protein
MSTQRLDHPATSRCSGAAKHPASNSACLAARCGLPAAYHRPPVEALSVLRQRISEAAPHVTQRRRAADGLWGDLQAIAQRLAGFL